MNVSVVAAGRSAEANAALGQPRARLAVLPNRIGLLLLFVLAVMLLGSINYNNNLGYLLTFLLAGIWVVSVLHTYSNVVGVEVLGAKAAPVFAGEEAVFEIYVHNPQAATRYALEVRPADEATAVALVFDLSPLTSHTVRLALAAPRRGVLPLPRLRLASRFPLGVCTAWMYWHGDASCVVYPHPIGVLPLPVLPDPLLTSQSGQQAGDEDFAGLRDYRPGDSLRHIAWKVLARERGLHVKKFAGSGEQRVRLRQQDVAFLGEIETQLSQLARWILDAEHRGLPYNLELHGDAVDFGIGGVHRDRCLQALAVHGLRS
ncbi:MAG: DUF58 domain-containing protein [Chromatiales bacterium]